MVKAGMIVDLLSINRIWKTERGILSWTSSPRTLSWTGGTCWRSRRSSRVWVPRQRPARPGGDCPCTRIRPIGIFSSPHCPSREGQCVFYGESKENESFDMPRAFRRAAHFSNMIGQCLPFLTFSKFKISHKNLKSKILFPIYKYPFQHYLEEKNILI